MATTGARLVEFYNDLRAEFEKAVGGRKDWDRKEVVLELDHAALRVFKKVVTDLVVGEE